MVIGAVRQPPFDENTGLPQATERGIGPPHTTRLHPDEQVSDGMHPSLRRCTAPQGVVSWTINCYPVELRSDKIDQHKDRHPHKIDKVPVQASDLDIHRILGRVRVGAYLEER